MIAPGLYAILDVGSVGDRSPVDVARALLRGGCSALQLRAKELPAGPLLTLARRLQPLAHAAGVPFFVNDDAEVARACGATGVHLGQGDLSVAEARQLLAPKQRIGLSTHDMDQALAAADLGADYIGLGPIFPTSTKPDAEPVVGLFALEAICTQQTLPVVAIGGITLERSAAVARTGAAAAAAISGVLGARDVEEAAHRFHREFRESRKGFPGPP